MALKISELEELLGVPRSAIRYFEKQGLISPVRNPDNDYREYSDEDVRRLKMILVLRKLGFSVSEIEDLFENRAGFEELLNERIETLEQQKQEVQGAIALCREMKNASVRMETFDADDYWRKIREKETAGYSFFDIASAEMQNVMYKAASQIEYSFGHGPRTPDLIFNPMRKTTDRINAFWQKHSVIQLVLVVIILALSLAFVIFLGNM